ncbi:hypothetical protein H2200_001486 [Cladophialophora chaetospira]|uniref:Uncharacterized protein n=1 Tax=Cladophialophora chaetospira TaxID=386627 RepID=A0AA38XL18_9EURO|nr:hypothetical protein H2200_001486 [Cladophialophora chaetospira]
MNQTPAHVSHLRGRNGRISDYKKELVEVQSLFYGRHYKQCIALCEQLQSSKNHALHQAFLWFYHAISYESIGLLAHNFSRNKLQFLDLARDSFGSAAKCLPLPHVTTEAGAYEQPEESPLNTAFRVSTVPADPISQVDLGSCPCLFHGSPCPKVEGTIKENEATPQNSAEQESQDEVEGEASSEDQHLSPATPATHKTRLSRVLSSPRALQDELVPSPLFSRNTKPAPLPRSPTVDITLRPLPPLPFNHKATFKMDGTRIVQDPCRKTAVQTLIVRFEGILPLPPATPVSDSPTIHLTPGIATPRFQIIRDAFSPDPHNDHLEAYLSSLASIQLVRYNSHLADFHARLRDHIIYTDNEIATVQKLQAERSAKKTLGPKQRLASFWSFQAVDSPCPRRGRAEATDQRESDDKAGGDNDAKDTARKERIDRLGREGWRVCKERHGFRGVAFYDDLARQVEAELDRRLRV